MRTPPGLIEEEARENVTPNVEVDFSEYMWMADELDEFDRQVCSCSFVTKLTLE